MAVSVCSKKALEILDSEEDGLEQLQDKCGIFGCIANGEWPTNLDVAHIICLGLVGLQHRSVLMVLFSGTLFLRGFPVCLLLL